MARRATHAGKKREEITEEDVRHAVSIITAEYYADVRGVAQDLMDRVKDGEITTPDGFDEALHEDIDGAQRVIYTWQARLGLIASSNHDAYFEEGLGDLDCKDGIPHEQLMYWAMRADVLQYLDSEGFDPQAIGQDEED